MAIKDMDLPVYRISRKRMILDNKTVEDLISYYISHTPIRKIVLPISDFKELIERDNYRYTNQLIVPLMTFAGKCNIQYHLKEYIELEF